METQIVKPMSHNQAIRQILSKNKNNWVSLPDLSEQTEKLCRSRCYVVHSRISDVRAQMEENGFKLLNKTEMVNGVKHSFYKLEMP